MKPCACGNVALAGRSLCSTCRNAARRKPGSVAHGSRWLRDGVKQCCGCEQWKTADGFYVASGRPDGLASNCKVCHEARHGYHVNPESGKSRTAKYRAADIERSRAAGRAHENKRNAIKRGSPVAAEADAYVKVLAVSECDCFYCGKEMYGAEHVDHFYALSTGGAHHPDNLVPACQKCNQRKSAKDPFAFLREMAGHMVLVISE